MKRLCTVLVGVVAHLAAVGVGAAADLPTAPAVAAQQPIRQAPSSAPENGDWGNSWYLRGDIAWSSDSHPQINAALVFPGSTQQQLGWAGSVGVGYHFNHWLRGDVTYGLRQTQVSLGGASIRPSEAMANLYIDIGTWGGFTPFMGAGVGKAFRKAESVGFGSLQQSSLAWALMIGVGWNLSDNIKLDLGYRYMNMGSVSGVNAGVAFKKAFTAHEARLGVRYFFQ